MKHLALIWPDGGTIISSMVLTAEVIDTANLYYRSKGKRPVFAVSIIGSRQDQARRKGPFFIQPDKTLQETSHADLIIIPSLGYDIATALRQNAALIDWVTLQYKLGAEVAGLCTGTFILAAAGLLKGKQCSTHWSFANTFHAMFPEVDLAIEKVITSSHGVYSSGGALSAMNLVLHIIEKYYDRETAIYCAKIFEIDPNRNDQSGFIIFSGQKNHEDNEIKKAQLFIEQNVESKIVIEELSSQLAIERRSFDRRFKKATGNTPVEYMQRVKMEAAKKSFETTRKTVNEVMYDVGYSDIKTFREVFKRITGISPVAYRVKYNKEATL